MKLINIYPLGNLCMEYNQDMHMYLTHMVEKYPAYVNVARKAPGYKILDNSLIELGGSADLERVLHAAERIGADEIILPDVFQNGPETIKAVENSLDQLRKLYPYGCSYKLMAVAQGKNLTEWRDCYDYLLQHNDIDVIGVPKVLAKMCAGGRPYMVNRYCDFDIKPHHLLGLWYSKTELLEYNEPEKIRSCDTVLGGFMAKHHLNPNGVRPDGFTVNLETDVIDYDYHRRESK